MYVPHSPFSSPRAGWSVPTTSGVGTGAQDSAKSKQAADLAHCFELHSGKLLGDKRNREGRLYFKVRDAWLACQGGCGIVTGILHKVPFCVASRLAGQDTGTLAPFH